MLPVPTSGSVHHISVLTAELPWSTVAQARGAPGADDLGVPAAIPHAIQHTDSAQRYPGH